MSDMTKPDKIFIDSSRKGTDWWIRPADQDDVAHGYEWDTEYTRTDLVPGWVSVDERLPGPGVVVLTTGSHVEPITAYNACKDLRGYEWYSYEDNEHLAGITHWMPIPPLHTKRQGSE